jgi:N-acetylglutamate synthase-like GNAT family acetyltransferase
MPQPDTTVFIREFQPGDEAAFRALNEGWINRYFRLEAKDMEMLVHPREKVLDPGGRILFATINSRCVGCCALLYRNPDEFEVAKMAVTASCQGIGVGRKLLAASIELARRAGVRRLYLETNHVLGPAIHLYESLGFRHIDPSRIEPSPYARADVYMELTLG